MKDFFLILRLVLQIIPELLNTITVIEKSIDKEKAGGSKKNLVLDIVNVTAEEMDVKDGLIPKIIKVVSKIIDKIISIFNETGKFETSK